MANSPAGRPAFYAPGPVTLARVLFFIAFVCFLVAALGAGGVVGNGDNWLAWALGGLAAVALAWAV